jgi:hypothetical protein
VEILALHEALESLSGVDPRKARVVELRYFGGLSIEETATILSVSVDTVKRDWRLARAWLLAELAGRQTPESVEEQTIPEGPKGRRVPAGRKTHDGSPTATRR